MERKDFIKKSLIGSMVIPSLSKGFNVEPDNDHLKSNPDTESLPQVGYNHLPNKEQKTMNTVIHKANTRGHANHGWLDSHHTFSFANYYNPERMNFGVLRVLNDDVVAGGQGFGTHPHSNMEIISIPLSGDLEHKDSMGNVAVIKQGDVQVLSAGTGIHHSEYNKNDDQEVKFLQIWVIPNKQSVEPRYDQISLREIEKPNEFYQILSPNSDDQGVWVHQDAWFSLGKFSEDKSETYRINKPGNGVYLFVLEGDAEVNGEGLNKRDGMGVWNVESLDINAKKGSKLLLMEVPMDIK